MQNVDRFGEFIAAHYNKEDFIKKLELLNKFKLDIAAKQAHPNNRILVNTLRMSLCEMK